MMDLALQVAATKLAISVVLGGAVWLATRGNQRPRLCHALCLALLAALLIPPLIGLPVLQPPTPAVGPAGAALASGMPTGDVQPLGVSGPSDGVWFAGYGRVGLVLLWLCGAAALVGWTLARTRQFRRLIRGASREAVPELRRMAGEIAHILGIERVPTIHTTDALISPMACWSGGAVRVLIPSALLEGLERNELRWILAHELAHVRRRDHVVRWLEWLACTAFWWNPVAWWARRRLRVAGELCCDALVVEALDCAPRDYARALVKAIDLVRTPRMPRLPAFASAAHSGHRTENLERRLRMIITNKPTSTLPPAPRVGLRCGLAVLLAFGLVYCSEQTSPTAVDLPTADLADSDWDVVVAPPAESPAGEASWSWLVPGGPADQPPVVVSGNAPLPTQEEQRELLAEIVELPGLPGGSHYQVFVGRRTSDGAVSFPERASGKRQILNVRSSSSEFERTLTADTVYLSSGRYRLLLDN